jgi:hypothetical protein
MYLLKQLMEFRLASAPFNTVSCYRSFPCVTSTADECKENYLKASAMRRWDGLEMHPRLSRQVPDWQHNENHGSTRTTHHKGKYEPISYLTVYNSYEIAIGNEWMAPQGVPRGETDQSIPPW